MRKTRNHLRRKMGEEALTMRLKAAEEEMFKDPEVREMIEGIREMWAEDDGMAAAFSASAAADAPRANVPPPPPPQTAAQKIGIPPSRIPELLQLLCEIPPSGVPTNPLMSANPLRTEARVSIHRQERTAPSETPQKHQTEPEQIDEKAIAEAEREIEALRIKLRELREQEEMIKTRSGPFAFPANRLKAERLLREIPGAIVHLKHRVELLRDGIL